MQLIFFLIIESFTLKNPNKANILLNNYPLALHNYCYIFTPVRTKLRTGLQSGLTAPEGSYRGQEGGLGVAGGRIKQTSQGLLQLAVANLSRENTV